MTIRPILLSLCMGAMALQLGGCATQQAMEEQTLPLLERITRLEQSAQSAAAATREQAAAAQAREAALAKRLDDLNLEFGALRVRQGDDGERIGGLEKRLDEFAASVPERVTKSELRLDELATRAGEADARIDALDAKQQGATTTLDALAERVTKAELRLDELATTAGAAEERIEALTEQQQGAGATADALAERVNKAETRLDEVATRAREAAEGVAAVTAAKDAAATELAALGDRLARTEARLDEALTMARQALAMATLQELLVNGKVAFSVTLTEDRTLYPLNSPDLGRQDRGKLDELVTSLNKMDQDYHLEIQGHTDDFSTDDQNYQLGKARAEVVKRYLHEKGGIPLGRMSVISYGASQPLDPNSKNNRRIAVLVRILE